MKAFLKTLFGLILIVVLGAGGFITYVHFSDLPHYPVPDVGLQVQVTPERVERGKVIANLACRECHLDSKTGKLTGRQVYDIPAEFGTVYSKNITQHKTYGIGSWTDAEIAVLLRTGINRNGRYTMPWMIKLPRMADEDILSIIAYLRSDDPEVQAATVQNRESERTLLAKLLARVAFKPFAYPQSPIVAPDPEQDLIAYGRYMVQDFLECYSCHSADLKTVDNLQPENSKGYLGGGNPFLGLDGKVNRSANITPDPETGIGNWSEQDFAHAIQDGLRPDGNLLRYPMPRMPEFSETDVRAIYAYLKTVPPLKNKVERGFPDLGGAALADGRAIFEKYGCAACHGEDGSGIGDVTLAQQNFPGDDQLRAWIENPSDFRPLTKMPAFRGILKEKEYAPLIAYIRELAN